jgi:hypothetical protein
VAFHVTPVIFQPAYQPIYLGFQVLWHIMTTDIEAANQGAQNVLEEDHDSDEEIHVDGEGEAQQNGQTGAFELTTKYPLSVTGLTLGCEGESKKKKKKKHKKKKLVQSDPPRIGLSKIFPNGHYPVGELQEYKNESVTSHY